MRRLIVIPFVLLLALGVQAAPNLNSLLREVQQAQAESARINQARVQRFLENKQNREQLLQQARAKLAPVENHTEELRARYDALQADISALQEKLDKKAGNLKQMRSVVHQVASNLQAVASESVISAQYPDRLERLAALAASGTVPGAEDLKDLWFLLQQAMTATAQVTTFKAPVVKPDGSTTAQRVTRVGPFVAVSDGAYLRYVSGIGLKKLARQPGGDAQEMAAALAAADEGLVRMAIDPTLGKYLSLLSEKPTLIERIQQGGYIGYLTIVLGVVGLLIAMVQFVRLVGIDASVRRQLKDVVHPSASNPLGRVLKAAGDADLEDAEDLERKLDEAVLREVPRLQRGQSLVKLFAAVAPLLGLLGTVVGMIVVFQTITLFGTSDPKLMAGGISKALITTVLGLVAAIPLLFAHSLLAGRSRRVTQVLEHQSAGVLARYLERGDDRRGA